MCCIFSGIRSLRSSFNKLKIDISGAQSKNIKKHNRTNAEQYLYFYINIQRWSFILKQDRNGENGWKKITLPLTARGLFFIKRIPASRGSDMTMP